MQRRPGPIGARRIPVALLFLLLPIALLPRTAVVVHEHSGGDRTHVHAGKTAGTESHDGGHGHDHDHDSHHHPHRGHKQHHTSAAPADTARLVHKAGHSAHWHTQPPYLLGLPPFIDTAIDLIARRPRGLEPQQTPPYERLALPFARGPPPAHSLPT